jgi:hypothetical protein
MNDTSGNNASTSANNFESLHEIVRKTRQSLPQKA